MEISRPVRIGLVLGKIAITVGLLWFALRDIDYSRTVMELSSARESLVLLGVLVLALQPVIGALRWYVIMRRLAAPILPGQSIRLTYVSTFLNQVLPGGVGGDAIRTWLTFREGHLLSHALNGVALDRVTGFVTLLTAASLCVIALDHYPALKMLELSLLPIAVVAVAGLASMMMLDRLPSSFSKFRPVRALGYLAKDARRIFLSASAGSLVIALAVLGNANLCVSLFIFMQAFNAPMEPWLLAASIAPVILASALPISVGGWGTREAASVAMMAALSAPPESAIVASVTFGLAGVLISLPGALFLYRSMQRRGHAAPAGTPARVGAEGRK